MINEIIKKPAPKKLDVNNITTQDEMKGALITCFPELKSVPISQLGMAIATCMKHNLNPFLKEVYLVKMGPKIAPIVNYITLVNKVRAMYPNIEEKWDYVKDAEFNLKAVDLTLIINGKEAIRQIVHMSEYASGSGLWKTKPNTMIQKVARAQGYRLLDPKFQDLYIPEEMPGKKVESHPKTNEDVANDQEVLNETWQTK